MLDASKPYRVRTTDGAVRSQHNSMRDAQTAAKKANDDAVKLGIRARYEAHDEVAA